MWSLMPVLIIVLALIAAGSIAYIAWEVTSEDFHNSFDEPDTDDRSDRVD